MESVVPWRASMGHKLIDRFETSVAIVLPFTKLLAGFSENRPSSSPEFLSEQQITPEIISGRRRPVITIAFVALL